ncbi:type I-E CRISPR-associated protein Cas6/Cse3/CasE [Methylocystis sp. WRRC1]|uniref:type I-E CRISPR-associated protein Cas6/Cse3/CasE n=1 Tax=Methylocystis sp. WRRC1 TaxID=1732014 RepID=UPI001D154295|nr:type I-E CRISPR-associated protein Cas6/Cse3/CasE [Methylocystis sp. WRRC1]MCC3246307.1 type I-E CRISPR-associated protein Cas6/Cse3/CasE [Methylocystis sp. WRRC1]
MREPLYFSRATLKRDPALEALAPVLMPADASARLQTDHRLVWSLFAGDRDAPRDFLFRRQDTKTTAQRAAFLILSKRPPDENAPLFDVETKSFEPALSLGDRLRFSLYANPTIDRIRRVNGVRVSGRHDVVMDALAHLPPGERAGARYQAICDAGRAWLERKAQHSGFRLDDAGEIEIDGYDQLNIARGDGRAPISVSALNFEGHLVVTEPQKFLRALAAGFGRARAFGCGLMLIRRA